MIESGPRATAARAGSRVGLVRYGAGLVALWTLALGVSLWWLLRVQRHDEEAAAAITARVSYEADVKYLNWLSALGGLYINPSEPFPPDPHFGGSPEQQIRLPDGTQLLPLTPIYVLRLVHELDVVPLEVSSSLRSLTPVVPEDEADAWESEALAELARGQREVAEIGLIDGEKYLRLMRPLRLGRDCVTCHARQGYQEGALQGGISVTVPMDRPEEFGRRSDGYVYATHGMLWLLGVGFIAYGSRKLTGRIRERDHALAAVSEERNFTASVLETVGALVVVLDAEGRIVRFNRACEQATGYGFAQVRGQRVWDLFLAPADRDSFRQRFQRLLADKTHAAHETPWAGAAGSPRIIAWTDTPLLDSRGEVEHVIATGVDLTEKRQTELALLESEERYRGLVESSPDAVLVHLDGRMVFCNPAGSALLAAPGPEHLKGRDFLDRVPSEARPRVAERLREVRERGLAAPVSEETLVALDGHTVEVELTLTPLRYRGQGAVQIIARDVSARRRAERALRDSEARYRTLVENVEFGITLVGADYRVVMSNAAQGRLFARSAGELVGRTCFREFEGRNDVCPHCPGTQALATGRAASAEVVRTLGDGTEVPLRLQAFPIVQPDGTTHGFIEVVEDVTALKRAEGERLRLEQKILQTQKLESLGVLAGGIAHDFNNLLMGVLGNVDLAMAKAPPESPLRPYLRKIDGAAQRAADLTGQMLAYSGRGKFVVEPIHLSRLVEELGHLLDTVVSKKATLSYRLEPNLPLIQADATQVRQVVMNLITNASDAVGDRPGTVTVSTGVLQADRAYLAATDFGEGLAEGRYVYVEVQDTGCGMDRDTRAKVFEPFFTTKQTGRGLGLAAVVGIVRGHRGGLRLSTEPGRGTTFRVLFPAPEGVSAGPGASQAGNSVPESRRRATVLVVDDDATVVAVAREMLEEHGYSVLTAPDGARGVAQLQAHLDRIDAVVLDLTMPEMNGDEAFREMRRLRPGLPVVLCSGYNEQEAASLGGHRSRFVHKPYRTKDLVSAVADVLDAGGGPPGRRPAPRPGSGEEEP